MQDLITLEGVVFDINALMEHLEQVSDRRSRRCRRYSLSFLLGVIILAKLCGPHRPSAIAVIVDLLSRRALPPNWYCQYNGREPDRTLWRQSGTSCQHPLLQREG